MELVKKKRSLSGNLRLFIQCAFAALSNGHLIGFSKRKIYTGPAKTLCVPGMNCYSCPASLGSCPIGSLQSALSTRQTYAVLYVLGFLTAVGTLFGRAVCGFLCPFGLLQDLLHKIPFPKKIRNLPGERGLRTLRFVLLALFVILLPLMALPLLGVRLPWFCKYICPVGTIEGGVPLVFSNVSLQSAAGGLFVWKLVLALTIVIAAGVLYRPFCRYLCPLGALYGLFNRFALYRYHVDANKCIGCGACQSACKLDIAVWKNPNSVDCIRCGACKDVCPTEAIQQAKLTKP